MITLSVSEIEKREFPIKVKGKPNTLHDTEVIREITEYNKYNGYAICSIGDRSAPLHRSWFIEYEIIEDKMEQLIDGDKVEITADLNIGDVVKYNQTGKNHFVGYAKIKAIIPVFECNDNGDWYVKISYNLSNGECTTFKEIKAVYKKEK